MSIIWGLLANALAAYKELDKAILVSVLLWASLLVIYVLLDLGGVISPRPIKGIPLVPSPPVFGSLPLLRKNSFQWYCLWAYRYGDVIQVRLGEKIVVVANSFQAIQELWVKNARANNSRPTAYSFHKQLSRSGVYTVGTTPFSDSYLKKKKFLSYSLNKKSIDQRSDVVDIETSVSVLSLLKASVSGTREQDILREVQHFTLRVALILTYGYFMGRTAEDKTQADEIIEVENGITGVRSHTSNWQDYLWFMKWLSPGRNSEIDRLRNRRERYLHMYYTYTRDMLTETPFLERCVVEDCLVAKVLKSAEEDMSSNKSNSLTHEELTSVCLTMLSAGLDNTGFNFVYCIGLLSQNKDMQITALEELSKCYDGDLDIAWHKCAFEMKCDYVKALVKETLRHYSVLPISLPRETTKPICYRGALIPAGTTLLLNTWAGNHDPLEFDSPLEFIPERFLDEDYKLLQACDGLSHFSFGAGTRMCTGSYLAFREMYTLLCKFLICFEITPPENPEMAMETDPVKLNRNPEAIAFEPKPFKVGLRARDLSLMSTLMDDIISEKRFLEQRHTQERQKNTVNKAIDERLKQRWEALSLP